jgi:tRNA(Ser,Leu) C12 N-acetylase TAN1
MIFLDFQSDDYEMRIANDGVVFGPIWLSKGERFRPTGAYSFLQSRYEEFQLQLKKIKKQYKEIIIIIKKRKRRTMIENDNNNNNETVDDGHDLSNEETDKEENDKVIDISLIQDKSLLSMTKKEIEELQKVKKKNH